MNLREDMGLTYGIYSQLRSFRQSGLLVISSSLQAEAAGAGLSEVFREMRNLAESAPAGSELDRARAELAGSFLRLLETPAAAVALELRRELALLPENYYADYLDRLTAVTSAELARLAADWFRPEDWCVVVVGDRRVLTPQLEKLGEVRLLKCGAARLETLEES
jgi:zinc protease